MAVVSPKRVIWVHSLSKKTHQKRKDKTASPHIRPTIIDYIFSFLFFLVDKLGHWIGLALVGYIVIYLPTKEFSGEDTKVLLKGIVDFGLKLGADKYIYWLACAFFGGGWYLERKSRQRYIKRHSQDEKYLLNQIDDKRGSSGLTDYGTQPKGKDVEK